MRDTRNDILTGGGNNGPYASQVLNGMWRESGGAARASADIWNYFWSNVTGITAPAPEIFLPAGVPRNAEMTLAEYASYRNASGTGIGGFYFV